MLRMNMKLRHKNGLIPYDKISRTVTLRTMEGVYSSKKYEYNGIFFRSKWEVKIAGWFDSLGMRWKYEPLFFKLSNGRHYIPDFQLVDSGEFAEVKGFLRDADRYAMDDFVMSGRILWYFDRRNIDVPSFNMRWGDGISNR